VGLKRIILVVAEESAVVCNSGGSVFSFVSMCDSSSRGRLPFERGGVVAV
jgi:hypothetical protein